MESIIKEKLQKIVLTDNLNKLISITQKYVSTNYLF